MRRVADERMPLFDAPLCLEQLRYSGLFEAIRIRRAGYSYRVPHEQFAKLFAIIYPDAFAASSTCPIKKVIPATRI